MGQINIVHIVAIIAAGLLSGFVNTLAGGGSFINLIALDFIGLPGTLANGTNRVAVQLQNIMAVLGFRSKGVSNFRMSLHFAIPALIGAIIGAYVIIEVPEVVFYRVLAVAMILMLFTIVFDTKKWLKNHQIEFNSRRKFWAYLVFLGVGFYGGAIQAGVGFLIIAVLVLIAGEDLVRTNGHKVFIIGTYTLFVLAMFAWKGQVNWLIGLLLGVSDGTGAWIASRLAVEKGEKLVRIVLGIMLAVMSVRYLGIIPGF